MNELYLNGKHFYNLFLKSYLSDTCSTCVQHGVIDRQELFQQVAEPDRVNGRDQHLKERHLLIVLEGRDDLLPQVHAARLKVHVTAPQVAGIGQLSNRGGVKSKVISSNKGESKVGSFYLIKGVSKV